MVRRIGLKAIVCDDKERPDGMNLIGKTEEKSEMAISAFWVLT